MGEYDKSEENPVTLGLDSKDDVLPAELEEDAIVEAVHLGAFDGDVVDAVPVDSEEHGFVDAISVEPSEDGGYDGLGFSDDADDVDGMVDAIPEGVVESDPSTFYYFDDGYTTGLEMDYTDPWYEDISGDAWSHHAQSFDGHVGGDDEMSYFIDGDCCWISD